MIEGLAATENLLVACDFDGTLAPIVDDPGTATALPEAMSALERLATIPGTTVVIVSGRRRNELVERFGDSTIVLIGEHGADDGTTPPPEKDSLDPVRRLMDTVSAETPGTRVEHKPRSVVFHYRRAGDPAEALDLLREEAASMEAITMMEGKAVLEMMVAGYDKGSAVERLRELTGADLVVFVGDDTTDETVFPRLRPGDVGIKVGPGPTAAVHRMADPQEVTVFLQSLARLRSD